MENNDLDMPTNTYAISQFPAEPVVAMAYVPYQNPSVIYSVEQGIQRGTLFKVVGEQKNEQQRRIIKPDCFI